MQCGGDLSVYYFTERPVWPPPQSYVDPMPLVFAQLAEMSRQITRRLGASERGFYVYLDEDNADREWNLTSLMESLSEAAQREVDGEALSPADQAMLRYVGAILEVLFIGLPEGATESDNVVNDAGRAERGVAIATDIYTKVNSQQALQLGVGRLLDLYVAVPSSHGRVITQGAAYSFYEFWRPSRDRLTDDAWNEVLDSSDAPALPDWSYSFIKSSRH